MEMIAEAPPRADHGMAPRAAGSVARPPSGLAAAGLSAAAVSASPPAPASREFLTFRLGGEEYGIDILRVQEIRSYEPPTRLANAPSFIKGVVNLRGVIVPIIDLRLKLGCDTADYNTFTVVVVLNVRGRVVGAVVDSVSDVLELTREQIRPAPMLNAGVDANFITGIGAVKNGHGENESERMLILMDIEGLMSSPDMGLINS